jgi:hypothetical protein
LENLSSSLQAAFLGGPKPKYVPLGVPYPDIFPKDTPEWETLKRRRGEWELGGGYPHVTTPPYVPGYILNAAPMADGEISRRPGEADEEGYENGTPYIRGEMPQPLPEREATTEELEQEEANTSNDPSEAFDRTLFPDHGENELRDEFDRSLFNDDIEGQIKEQNKPGYRKLLTDYDRPPPKIDMDKFADTLNKNALPKSENWCAKYVRIALEKAGADTRGHPKQAKDWGPTLERNGFVILDKDGYTPQKGDIVVIQPYKPFPKDDGHMAAYDGKQWISDHKQRDFWGGDGYRTKKPPYEIYRQLPY